VETPLIERIARLGLARTERLEDASPSPSRLEALCDEGFLEGGFAVELRVRPDELLGPLMQWMGGTSRRLKILDVRDHGNGVELALEREGRTETWELANVRELVAAMNAAFAEDPSAKVVAILGEWNDALQLWALPKAVLPGLRREPWFQVENAQTV
jgi:hypothetical protein